MQTGEGLKRSYEALKASPNAYKLPALVLNDEKSMSIFKTSRQRWGFAFVAIGIIVALAVGLGAGLGSRKRYVLLDRRWFQHFGVDLMYVVCVVAEVLMLS